MQQVLKLILILMITTTCGQNNEDTTITPPEDEEGSTVVASQEDSPSLPPSHKAVGLSDKDRKELGNMVLVDLLCVKLNPTVIPSCVINRKKLDAFLLMKKHLLGTHQTSLDPESLGNGIPRGPTEDIIHYFTLMSSELHYLDIILKIENLTLMSSASGKFDINVLSIWENHLSNTHIFVILPVLFLFSHVLNASEQLQLLIYALLSLKCRELHLRVF